MTYTIHASHHPGANERPATADAIASWITIFDGPLYSDGAARGYAEEIGRQHRSVRVFKHARSPSRGDLWYLVIDGHPVAI